MQISIQPVDLYHYNIYKLNLLQSILFGKDYGKTLLGSATISLDGQNIDLYCENNNLSTYYDAIGKQAYSCYLEQIEKI